MSTWGTRPEMLGEGGASLLRPTEPRDPDPCSPVKDWVPGLEVRAGPGHKLPVFPRTGWWCHLLGCSLFICCGTESRPGATAAGNACEDKTGGHAVRAPMPMSQMCLKE